jgi:hypothetical protein
MTHHEKRSSRNDYGRLAVTAVAIFIAAYLLLSNTADRTATAEARFADTTNSGLSVVPASGASETSYTGAYISSYTGSYTGSYVVPCGGMARLPCPATASYTGTYTGSYTGAYGPATGSYTGAYTPATGSYTPATGSYTPPPACWDGSAPGAGGACPPCPTGYTQVGNTCVPPDGPQFVGFTSAQGFNASGHLEVRPSLVRSGDTTRVYWNVTNVRDCTVTGSNGDQWSRLASGASGQVTGPIVSRTDYTLFCHSLTGATPSTITETRTVNVLPSWYEPSGN